MAPAHGAPVWQGGWVHSQQSPPRPVPPRSHLEPVRLIILVKYNTYIISFNPDNIPKNCPHCGSLITSSKCRLFLNLGILLGSGLALTFEVADLGCVSCLVAPILLLSSWISRWRRHWPRPCHEQLEHLNSAALQLPLA